jgi:hypothetical protein
MVEKFFYDLHGGNVQRRQMTQEKTVEKLIAVLKGGISRNKAFGHVTLMAEEHRAKVTCRHSAAGLCLFCTAEDGYESAISVVKALKKQFPSWGVHLVIA